MKGRVIDKYEILEEVGQGGMAVVYKGRDTSLEREVAVKVLHPHLASHKEARERFEREARAVAKLHHENILEIFDYSGKDSTESYIVTEFIRGGTLREFLQRHTIDYPEVGVMIAAEVCQALAHAHAMGILHRDIKPENIMLREDGVVKLTDFGIAQVVDAQRLTVTGQLLGSPAYMSPEHVEGGRLDFRTDVFSMGILLYQLTTGELPFKGKNPHEILKKIADCKYIAAPVVNPLVSDRLGRILDRTLAREKDGRYPDVSLLLNDLNEALAEVDLTDSRAELKKFFKDPAAYQAELRARLIASLKQRGKTQLAQRNVARALAAYNRVLTLDPSNEEVLREIDRISSRRRNTRVAVLAVGVLALGAGGFALIRSLPDRAPAPAVALAATPDATGSDIAPSPPDAEPLAAAEPDAAPRLVETAGPPDARPRSVVVDRRRQRPDAAGGGGPAARTHTVRIAVRPKSSVCSVDGGELSRPPGGNLFVEVGRKARRVFCKHPEGLTEEQTLDLPPDDERDAVTFRLAFRPTWVVPRCPGATSISVDGKPAGPGVQVEVSDFRENGSQTVKVEFYVTGTLEEKVVTVRAGDEPREVRCSAR